MNLKVLISRFIISLFISGAAFSARALCVSTYEANLREGPGPKYKVTWTVSKYTPLIAISSKNGWIEVEDQDGKKHWLYGQNATDRYNCLSIKTWTAKLREQGSNTAPLADIRQVDKYTPFKRLDRIEEWYQVEAPWGGEYWVHESTIWRPLKVSTISY
ncbi:MAG: SH3 domain-containing protein [Bdellovibrionota bacterium]